LTAPTDLPVLAVLPALREALAAGTRAVLVAPPGAGKTTAVPPALLSEPWAGGGKLLLMLPRRLAARAAASRIASLLGTEVGEGVGYVTRLEASTGPRVQIECLTEGIFTRRLLEAPELPGVAGLLFDELHERNLEGDLGLALALDAAAAFRPDLRILAMSATLDGAAVARLLGDAPVIEAQGRPFPLALRHRPGPASERLEDAVARGVAEALADSPGSVLVFLPGVGEIGRAGRALAPMLPEDVSCHALHGTLPPDVQRRLLEPGGGRRVILATSIAETSLTVPGVTAVVDSGLARRPQFDRGSGLTSLRTVKASQASLRQRAGRAARTGPGLAIRLFAEGEMRGRIAFDPPEIVDADLAPMLLTLLEWGAADPAALPFLDPPPAAAVADARARLLRLGAIDADSRLTLRGRALARLPMAPPIGALLLAGAASGEALLAAEVAVLLSERGAGGDATDLEDRLVRFRRDGSAVNRRLAGRWARLAASEQPVTGPPRGAAALLADALPERVARRRRAPGARDSEISYLMASGRAAVLPAGDPLAAAEWLVVADAGGSGPDSRIRLAARLDTEAPALVARHAVRETRIAIEGDRIRAEVLETLGAIVIGRRPDDAPDPLALAAALEAHLLANGLPLVGHAASALARLRVAAAAGFEGLPSLDDAAVARALVAAAGPVRRVSDLLAEGAIAALVPPALARALDRFAPLRFEAPAGSSHAIDYAADGGPEVEVRVQALFGLAAHPTAAGQPLTLALTSPAGRVIQKTRDLPAFWRGSWADVRKELRGRYPKHEWPEDPLAARPTLRARPRP
jgi:ATP-dependent helicase HrpB